jgi:hypothetical protein
MDEEFILSILETGLFTVRASMAEQWDELTTRLALIKGRFAAINNQYDLILAVDQLFMICIQYQPIKDMFHLADQQSMKTTRKPNPVPKTRTDLQGIAQRYITLIDKLKNMDKELYE